jgi:hypothetical protein
MEEILISPSEGDFFVICINGVEHKYATGVVHKVAPEIKEALEHAIVKQERKI